MKNTTKSIFAAMAALLASAAPGGEDSPLLKRGADGFGDVRSAAFFARDGKMDEGRAFIAELRARPSEGRSTEELQSVDMAEFALLRKDVKVGFEPGGSKRSLSLKKILVYGNKLY